METKRTLTNNTRQFSKENWKFLAPDGTHIFTNNKKRAMWYLSNGLAVQEDEYTIRLTFEPNGMGFNGDDIFGLSPRESKCVVCGDEFDEDEGDDTNLQRHHIVPTCFRKYFPVEWKSKNHHDVVLICVECHEQYERSADDFKDSICEKYGVPLFTKNLTRQGDLGEFKREKAKDMNLALALYEKGSEMPKERVKWIKERLRKYPDCNPDDMQSVKEFNKKLFKELKSLERKVKPQGKLVINKILKKGECELFEFIKSWRRHFLENANPDFMPNGWDVARKPTINSLNTLDYNGNKEET